MNITQALPLLGGLSPARFMKRHWQKKPLLVRGAVPGFAPLLAKAELFALAARDEVESRLVAQTERGWQFRRGWTLLVQGADLHVAAAHDLLAQFRFVPEARLDDLMISYATDGGGVGPHFDSYDVFLLQAHGRRRWRIGRQPDFSLRDDVPLKILANFAPEEEHVLDPGDMLYLPPGYAHDGIAEGECQTYSIGFRSPGRAELARELLQRLADDTGDIVGEAVYPDPGQPATATPGALPPQLQRFARDALRAVVRDPLALDRALGEYMTEPKANVWFEGGGRAAGQGVVRLDSRTRMMYDEHHVFVNGESWRAAGRDAALMRRLADRRALPSAEVAGASNAARSLLQSWAHAGWLHFGKARQ
jgi:50S ribosomal protein L16 3-hydroxylase